MFKKLLKYDMKAVWRLWWISAIIVPIAALIGGLMMRYFISVTTMDGEMSGLTAIFMICAMLTAFACIMAISLSFFLTIVLVFSRFYKNLFTDEGYLTFTLPVTRRQLLLSKTVNAYIWYILHGVLLVVGIIIFFLLAMPAEVDGVNIMNVISEEIPRAFKELGKTVGSWVVWIGVEYIVCILVGTFMSITLFQFSITVGSIIAKKAKILVAIGIYYATNSILPIINQLLMAFLGYGISFWGVNSAPMSSDMEAAMVIFYLLLIEIIIMAIVSVVLYLVTQYLFERKLNLA